jgi:glycosyltransferase involved in cell wall biosynthesis
MSKPIRYFREGSILTGSRPLVSILVCSWNAGEFLVPALRSALGQTYAHLEVLVVDDGSTDGSVEAAKTTLCDDRIRWFRQENAGKPVALNLALRELKGDYYALQDADDLSYPMRIDRLVKAMEARPEVAAVYSGHDLIIEGRHVSPRFRAKGVESCRADVERMVMPAHDPTGMYRVSMVQGIAYDPVLRVGQGYDYMLRVGERWPMLVLGECLYSYRVSRGSVTRSDPQRRQQHVYEVLRRACKRRGVSYDRRPAMRRRASISRRRAQDNNLAAHFIDSVLDQRQVGRVVGAVRTGLQCSRLHPLDLHYYKALIYAISPWWLIACLRRH